MNERPPRRPVRWEDLTDCLAWPLLLRLPGLALRWSRLLVGYVVAIPLLMIWHTRSPILAFFGRLLELVQSVLGGIVAPWFFGPMPRGDSFSRLWMEFAAATSTPNMNSWTAPLLVVLAALVLIGMAGSMLSRSTALEVSRGLEVSPRYMVGWLVRRWTVPLLCLWPIPLAVLLALPAAVLVLISTATAPGGVVAAVLLGIAVFLAFIALVLILFAFAAAPLTPAAASCDDGDSFDDIQRTIAIVLGHPIRTILCFAWVLLVMRVLAGIARWLVDTAQSLIVRGSEELASAMQTAALPLEFLPTAVGLSAFGSGITLAYLYLRRIADEQDFSEVPVQG